MQPQVITITKLLNSRLATDTCEGSIIFGGIDTKKYIGNLEKRPIIPYMSAPDGFPRYVSFPRPEYLSKQPRYWVYMTSVGITVPGNTTSKTVTPVGYNQPIFPDSGSTLCSLPTAAFNSLLAYFLPGAVNQGDGTYVVDCALKLQPGTIDFGFGAKVIKVSYNEWFWFDGAECYFGAVATDNTWLLGGLSHFLPLKLRAQMLMKCRYFYQIGICSIRPR